jgi:hypothetical protein
MKARHLDDPRALRRAPVWHEIFDADGHPRHRTEWRLPSGCSAEVTIRRGPDGRQRVTFTWTRPPTNIDEIESFLDGCFPGVLVRVVQALNPLNASRALPVAGGSTLESPDIP